MHWLFTLTLLISAACWSQEPVVAKLVSEPFVETYQPEVSVSGNVVVGVMLSSAAGAITTDNMVVLSGSSDEPEQLCLRAVSRDGIYSSKNVYELPAGSEASIRLPYESRMSEILRDYGEHELALSATAGGCDSGAVGYHILGSADARAFTDILVYVNSFGATDVFYDAGSGAKDCSYISEGRRTTFDFICEIPIETRELESNEVLLIRERFGREQPPVNIRIFGANR